MCYSHDWCSKLICINAHWFTLLLYGFPGGALGPATVQPFKSFGACTNLLLVWLRGLSAPITRLNLCNTFIILFSVRKAYTITKVIIKH